MAYLVVTMKGKELYRRELTGSVTVGRSTDCHVWINDASVSRRHCRLEPHGDAWEVHDLGSRNGIVLHGERVAKHALNDGDSIHIGAARVTFHAVGFVASRPTRPSAPQGSADSISDTIVSANSVSRAPRVLPAPRATMPPEAKPQATEPAAPLPFTRPPARPIPAASESPDEDGPSNGGRRAGLLRRFLHK